MSRGSSRWTSDTRRFSRLTRSSLACVHVKAPRPLLVTEVSLPRFYTRYSSPSGNERTRGISPSASRATIVASPEVCPPRWPATR